MVYRAQFTNGTDLMHLVPGLGHNLAPPAAPKANSSRRVMKKSRSMAQDLDKPALTDNKKPKMHHLKANRKNNYANKAYLYPLNTSVKQTSGLSSAKSYESLSSPLSDYIEEVDEQEEQMDEIDKRVNIWRRQPSQDN